MNDKPTCHLLSLPHTQTVKAFDHCAYTSKTRKLASMLHDQGYRVVLYAGDENEARCDELVTILSARKQREILKRESWWKAGEIYALPYDETSAIWEAYNSRAIKQIGKRIQPRDIICLASGTHAPVMRAFPEHLSVETGVGYSGTCAKYRVFESAYWQAAVYGEQMGAANGDGRFYDAIIDNFFECDDFPAGDGRRDFYLFMSRATQRKGYQIAVEACEHEGAKLLIAGVGGDPIVSPNVEHVGLAGTEKRAALMGAAKATFVPTLYLGPFEGVAVESLLCGTPVICTPWGAFTGYIEQGVNGFMCHTMREFTQAMKDVEKLDRRAIRESAIARFSVDAIGPRYAAYFSRLGDLFEDGFYQGMR